MLPKQNEAFVCPFQLQAGDKSMDLCITNLQGETDTSFLNTEKLKNKLSKKGFS